MAQHLTASSELRCQAEDIKNAVNSMIDAIDPAEDNRGPVEFKKHAAAVVLSRAIERAWQRA